VRIERQIAIPTVISCLLVAGCAGGPAKPGFYYMKRGLTETAYQHDVEHCAQQGKKAMADYGKPTATATGINYHDKKYGAAPGIAAQATNSFVAGYQRGQAKRQAYSAAHEACMRGKGYSDVQLTQAEGEAFASLSKDEQKAQFARWATGQQRTTNSK
jgi:hypothetical protein